MLNIAYMKIYVCVYLNIYIYIHLCVYVCTYTCMYICSHKWISDVYKWSTHPSTKRLPSRCSDHDKWGTRFNERMSVSSLGTRSWIWQKHTHQQSHSVQNAGVSEHEGKKLTDSCVYPKFLLYCLRCRKPHRDHRDGSNSRWRLCSWMCNQNVVLKIVDTKALSVHTANTLWWWKHWTENMLLMLLSLSDVDVVRINVCVCIYIYMHAHTCKYTIHIHA